MEPSQAGMRCPMDSGIPEAGYSPMVPRPAQAVENPPDIQLHPKKALNKRDLELWVGTDPALTHRIPLWGGVLITIADTFVFLFLDKYGNFCFGIPGAKPGLERVSGW